MTETAVVEPGSLSESRLLELCMNNGGETGLWKLFANAHRQKLHETNSEEDASRKTAIAMAGKLKVTLTQSKKLYEDLRTKYA